MEEEILLDFFLHLFILLNLTAIQNPSLAVLSYREPHLILYIFHRNVNAMIFFINSSKVKSGPFV
jgi:hypothetical protein